MEISLSLSGGGLRASAYHLGVLHYLNRLVLPNNKKLLDCVNVIAGISGGALTALWFVRNEVKGKHRDILFRELYHILEETNIAQEILDNNFNEKNPQCQFTRLLSEAYDKYFFKGELFGDILDGIENCHIHHFSVDATDFNSGLPFRFQATHKMSGANPYGFIGNNLCNLPRDLARTIKLADVMTASSCFPVAFEPLVIDCSYNESFKNSTFLISHKPIVLMDGGIIDNLGIDPIERASEQLKNQSKEIDLMILSDVSQKDFPSYTQAEMSSFDFPLQKPFSIYNIASKVLLFATFVFIVLGTWLFQHGNTWYKFILGLIVPCGTVLLLNHIYIRPLLSFPEIIYNGITIPINAFKRVSVQNLAKFTLNRLKSAYMMANNITMSHIRRKFLNGLYADKKNKDKTILNAQYTLTSTGNWKNRMMTYTFLPKAMTPSQEIHNITDEAHRQPTTLWFTREQKEDKILDKLVACGQYTTCWNLLLYINKLENAENKKANKDKDNRDLGIENDGIRLIPLLHIKKQLMDDWRKFNNDPLFMVNRIK